MSKSARDAYRALELRGRRAVVFKSVLGALADFHNDRTGQCNPGTAAISRAAGVLRQSAPSILLDLKDQRFIDYETNNRGGKGRSNAYALVFLAAFESFGSPKVFYHGLADGEYRFLLRNPRSVGRADSIGGRELSAGTAEASAGPFETVGRGFANSRPGRQESYESSESVNLAHARDAQGARATHPTRARISAIKTALATGWTQEQILRKWAGLGADELEAIAATFPERRR